MRDTSNKMMYQTTRGVTKGGKGRTITRAPNHCGGRHMTAEGAEISQQYHKCCFQ